MTELDALIRVFSGLDRQGPGSDASTRKALSLLPGPIPDGAVLDLGCGTGASTLVLARALDRPIIASDVNPDSLALLRRRLADAGITTPVETRVASMDAIDLPAGSAGLIWSEGATFTVGIERALAHWWPLLAPGGFVAFTDLMWTGSARPAEAAAFLDGCYEGFAPMPDLTGVLTLADRLGYRPEAHFLLPASDWWDEYYAGLSVRLDAERPGADAAVAEVIARSEREMEIVRRYATSFAYVFLILAKPAA